MIGDSARRGETASCACRLMHGGVARLPIELGLLDNVHCGRLKCADRLLPAVQQVGGEECSVFV
jgi:hypothetical protein